MPYQPSSLVQLAWQHHPRCLSEFDAAPLKNPSQSAVAFNELGYFTVSCRCGSKHWQVLGYPHPEAVLLCPISLECAECHRVAKIFDVEIHGYDAELGNGCYSLRGEGQPSQHACSQCAGTTFEVFPSFSYQIDPDEMSEEEMSRVQDLFDGFNLEVRCSNCGTIESPVGYECA